MVNCIISDFASELDLIHGSLLMELEAIHQVACLKYSSFFSKVHLPFKVLRELSEKRVCYEREGSGNKKWSGSVMQYESVNLLRKLKGGFGEIICFLDMRRGNRGRAELSRAPSCKTDT